MKERILQISNIVTRLILFSLISGIFFVSQAHAQPKPGNAEASDVWEVHWWVSVKGDFKTEGEVGSGDPTIFYHIKRNYEGAAELLYLPRQNDPKAAKSYPQFKDPFAKVHITINDKRVAAYDLVCDELDSVEDTWTAEVFSASTLGKYRVPALLLVNNEKLSYKTSFPILYLPDSTSKDVEHDRREVTSFTSGEEKVKNFPKEYQSLITHGYPTVAGFIENDSIIRAPDWSELKFDSESNIYSWSSGVLHPDQPLIHNVPESKDNIDIVISYNLIRKVKG